MFFELTIATNTVIGFFFAQRQNVLFAQHMSVNAFWIIIIQQE